jgi:hypothetical protein
VEEQGGVAMIHSKRKEREREFSQIMKAKADEKEKDKRGSRAVECSPSKACLEAPMKSDATATLSQQQQEKERKHEQNRT